MRIVCGAMGSSTTNFYNEAFARQGFGGFEFLQGETPGSQFQGGETELGRAFVNETALPDDVALQVLDNAGNGSGEGLERALQWVIDNHVSFNIVAVNLSSGDVVWEQLLSPPSGRSDLDRLADIDGAIGVVGQDVYAAGYQGNLAALAAESGQILWSRDISTFEGVSADWNNLYTVTEEGEIIALARRTGDESWRQGSLLRREPTLPVSFSTTVAVGDLEGYLHFFSNFSGEPVARLRLGSQAISTEPVVVADRLYVQSDSGSLSAFIVQQPKRPGNAPDVAEDDGA